MRFRALCSAGLAIVLIGCGRIRGIESKGAVRDAIQAHLKQRSNVLVANMAMEVQEVRFSGNRAEAVVKYQSKQSPELAVRVQYVLRRAGDHWEVESSSPAGGMPMSPHGSAGSSSRSPADSPRLEPSH